ncbi:MAG: 1-deoxy-D-xylulose-5-phosphate synthase [Clostridia bacterium]|nr:1-deoxy-D-xylulose-5-phosphate synthase [Clostridia bacterium]
MISLTREELLAKSPAEAKALCADLRAELVEVVTRNGGHLASNLGAVEISVALARGMDLPREKVIYDTGHQCYVHKILTDRGGAFDTLRTAGGISGFPRREESPFDAFGTGHSGTGISAAIGFARGAEDGVWTAVVIGDGSFTGGMVFEALNNLRRDDKIIVILNDNGMSISRSTGSLKRALNRMRTAGYYRAKDSFHGFLDHIPLIGKGLTRFFRKIKNSIKRAVLPANNLFEQYGMHYFGPADGNDLATVEFLLREAKTRSGPSLIHLCTKKGKGYRAAEHDPEAFHGLSPRDAKPAGKTFTALFGEAITEFAAEDERIVAITAAMQKGVGLDGFAGKYPRRLYDVGIAEEHAMTFAAALAAGGKKPVFAVYSTFFQRAYDQFVHDAVLQKLPVVVCLDRAGITGEDGATHQGVLDLAMTLPLPGVKIYAPISGAELREDLKRALAETESPSVLRWCKGAPDEAIPELFPGKSDPECCSFAGERRLTVVTFGRTLSAAAAAAKELEREGIGVDLVRFHKLSGFDEQEALSLLARLPGHILFAEEGVETGGFSQTLLARLAAAGIIKNKKVRVLALSSPFVPHGDQRELLKRCGLDTKTFIEEGRALAQIGSDPG